MQIQRANFSQVVFYKLGTYDLRELNALNLQIIGIFLDFLKVNTATSYDNGINQYSELLAELIQLIFDFRGQALLTLFFQTVILRNQLVKTDAEVINRMNSRTARRLEKLNKCKEVLRSIVIGCCSKQNNLVVCVRTGKLMQPLVSIA